jgi:deoxyadenosine/deoxycytidine kinase
MLIVVGGMIGLGKTSVAELLGRKLGGTVFYESVEDNPILPLFYTMSEEELKEKRVPFLLQLYFLRKRFDSIKEAYLERNNILDRSIFEDWYFAKVNKDLGRISSLEFIIYEDLLNSMMQEIEGLPQKKPDLMIYLTGSFDTVLKRISRRGRDFEQDAKLIDYYRRLWAGYDDWVYNKYNASPVITINMDDIDVVKFEEDAAYVIELVREALGVSV